jgi:hypothetical protein
MKKSDKKPPNPEKKRPQTLKHNTLCVVQLRGGRDLPTELHREEEKLPIAIPARGTEQQDAGVQHSCEQGPRWWL